MGAKNVGEPRAIRAQPQRRPRRRSPATLGTCGGEFCDQTSANARVAQRRGCGHVEDFGQGQLKLQCRLHGAVACQKGHAPRTLHPAPRVLPLHTLHMPGTAACRSAN